MCELLVKAVDATHPDPEINLSGCYKRGDVVVIKEDGFNWGIGERDTNVFEVVKMPGVPVDDMKHMLYSNNESIANTAALKIPALAKLAKQKTRGTLNRKRFNINLSTLEITDKARV